MKKKIVILLSACLCGAFSLYAQDYPNAANFLPSPPKQGSTVRYVNDYVQYAWGKAMRSTERGDQAKVDMPLRATAYASAFSTIIGLDITERTTPKIYTILDYAVRISERAAETPQNYYKTDRPYVSFNESTLIPGDENTYRNTGSFPCVQAAAGWLSALMLVEVVPSRQNEVLARGYDFGDSPIIAGYNWYSDVTAGRHLGSALFAYLHSQGSFVAMLTDARNEYIAKGGLYASRTRADGDDGGNDGDDDGDEADDEDTVIPYVPTAQLPDGMIYLPGPPASETMKFGYDLAQHLDGKALRPYSDGRQAVEDVNNGGVDGWCKIYASAFGRTMSESATPQLYELIKRVDPSANAGCQSAKAGYLRQRPYVQLDESTAYPADEDHLRLTGSYPSGHAAGSWLIAMLLSEINPSGQDALYARAYQFGQGRVITGYHWQSDVDDGRIVASAVFACLHNNADFQAQLARAKAEYSGSSTRIAAPKAAQSDAPVYNLQGVRLMDPPSLHGIYIQGNQKITK